MTPVGPTSEMPLARVDPPWPGQPADGPGDGPHRTGAFPVPWTVLDAVGIVLWTLVAQLLVGVPMAALGFDASTPLEIGIALLAVESVTIVGILGWLRARGILSWRILGPVRPRWRHVGIGAGVGIAGFVLATVLPELIRRGLDIPPPPRQQILDFVATGDPGIWLVVLIVVLVAPFLEEVVFRGLLFQVLRRRLGLWPGIILSSVTFSIVHLELIDRPIQLAALLVLGAWLAGALDRTGSLVVPITAHALFNGVAIAATLGAPVAG
ncbi:MAG: CPBP family intramembrane metalloprotease [Actinobacteria bacterium]|nr:CPBP family intramembrane metalloprotease [Actinomycetota bacterium]